MTSVKLSVSIVSYHNFNDIKRLLESIKRNTSSELSMKIYVIDNANEQDQFRELVKQYPELNYIHTGKNLGFGKGHNYVLSNLDSEYHAIVNPDVLLKDDAFSILIDFIEKTGCGMAVPKLVTPDGERLAAYRKDPNLLDMLCRIWFRSVFPEKVAVHELSHEDYSKPFKVPFVQGSFLVCKTDLFKQLNGFDESFFMYLEDADLCRRMNQISDVMYCPYTTVEHRWEKGSHKNFHLFRIHIQSWIKYFKKWGWL